MTAPERLYKYESFSSQSLENLKNQVIFFGSPKNFNDPYDCALFPTIKEPSDEEVENIRAHYLSQTDLPEKARNEFLNSTSTKLRSMLLRIGQNVLENEIAKFRSGRGVSCFSETPSSILMWSHYAGNHRGFCLEFDATSEPFNKIRKVSYSQTMPAFDLVPMLCDQDFDQILDLFCTKSADWEYEREWRAMHKNAGTAFHYPASALTGAYFGPQASFTSIEIAALVLSGQNPDVKLWQGSRSESEFSVVFKHVTYTNHLEAKRRGLL
jgi:hypothetical protein